MKFAATTLALMLATVGASAFAAGQAPTGPARTLSPQQQKMKDCNAQAADKKGDERKAFMSACLKSGSATSAPAAAAASPTKPMTQQEKMKSCNVQATDQHLAGADRTKFMSSCLKGSGNAPAAPAAAAN
jgi:hypothetical protein